MCHVSACDVTGLSLIVCVCACVCVCVCVCVCDASVKCDSRFSFVPLNIDIYHDIVSYFVMYASVCTIT